MQTDPSFRVQVITGAGIDTRTVVLTGEVDFRVAARLRHAIGVTASARPQELVLDVAAVTFLDAAAARALVQAARSARQAGTTVTVHEPGPVPRRILAMAGLFDDDEPGGDDTDGTSDHRRRA
jgi:anti-anti-sigma factor